MKLYPPLSKNEFRKAYAIIKQIRKECKYPEIMFCPSVGHLVRFKDNDWYGPLRTLDDFKNLAVSLKMNKDDITFFHGEINKKHKYSIYYVSIKNTMNVDNKPKWYTHHPHNLKNGTLQVERYSGGKPEDYPLISNADDFSKYFGSRSKPV